MNRKNKIFLCRTLVAIPVVITPIVATSYSKLLNVSDYKYQSIWNLNNKSSIYLENHNLGSDLNNIKLFDEKNNEIEFDKENSKISDNNDAKTFYDYNLIEDQKYFFDLVKDMSQNKIPSIGLMRDATFMSK